MISLVAAPLFRGADNEESRSKSLRFAAVAALGLSPVFAAATYIQVGAPHALGPRTLQEPLEDPAAALAAMAPEERAAMIENMVEGLAARLETDPENLRGWRMLARSYGVLGRHQEATDAWREALVLSEGQVDDWRGLAMALIELRDQTNAPAIKEAFEEVLLQEPNDALALYFLGHASQSDGDEARARELWTRLRGQTPDDAPLAEELDGLLSAIADAGAAGEIDPGDG
jgi:cytochrome c-type biogenesis protein CcmH